jgi:hypothetical protein
VRRSTSTALAEDKWRPRHLRLVVENDPTPNLDPARGLIHGLLVSGLFWLIGLILFTLYGTL